MALLSGGEALVPWERAGGRSAVLRGSCRLGSRAIRFSALRRRGMIMTVANILQSKRPAVLWVSPVLSVGAAAECLRSANVGVMIVSNDGESLLGLISERDIAHGLAVHGATLPSLKVSDLMAHSVITCTRKDSVPEIARIMTMRRIRHIPVMDGKRVVGLVSIGDVLKSRISEVELEASVLRDLAVTRR